MANKRGCLPRLLLLILVIVALSIAVAPLLPLNPLKPAVESRLSTLLGREVSVGTLRLSLLGGPYLVINKMVAKEDPAFGEGNIIEAEKVHANVALLPLLLQRQVSIDGIRIESPVLKFIKNDQGVWSWATLGQAGAAPGSSSRVSGRSVQSALLGLVIQVRPEAAIDKVEIENASVRLVDMSGAQPPESLYRNVSLRAEMGSPPEGAAPSSRKARGELRAQSEEGEGAELLKAELPFDLVVEHGAAKALTARGSLGPGHLESKNFAASSFKSNIDLKGSVATLDQMEISLYEGAVRGHMQVDLATQQFSAEGQVENLSLERIGSRDAQGAGQITGHVNAQFKLQGLMRSFDQALPTINGSGHMTSNDLFIASVNLSEQVARSLKIDQIGDMNPGTALGSVESDFQIEQGVIRTSNLRIQQMDGLGDASARDGWFQTVAPPSLSYSATVLLSPEATAKVKSSSPLFGVAISILESNSRVAVPVNITGEVRSPQVHVDVYRIFQ
ncbi:MAG TPA: AsmA family protein [Blastocatellia bacterium]|nr:AsmA family protein [Blastocatellia bacterium]